MTKCTFIFCSSEDCVTSIEMECDISEIPRIGEILTLEGEEGSIDYVVNKVQHIINTEEKDHCINVYYHQSKEIE